MSTTAQGSNSACPTKRDCTTYDLWHGTELTPTVKGNEATLEFDVEGLGFGAVLASPQNPAARSH